MPRRYGEDSDYLLVDEILVIIILDAELPLHFLDLGALQEYLALDGKHLLSGQLALAHMRNELAGIFQFLSETPELFGALSISPAGLANLADLAPTEADIRVGIVGILTSFKLAKSAEGVYGLSQVVTYLEAPLQWSVPCLDSSRLPMLIDVRCEALYTLLYSCVHGLLHFWKRQDGRAIDGCKRLVRLRRFLEEVHDLLELVFGALHGIAQPHVQGLEEDVILVGHVIWASAAVLDGRRKANIGGWLRKYRGVERVISEVTEDGLRGRDVGFVDFSLGRRAYGGLQVEFL